VLVNLTTQTPEDKSNAQGSQNPKQLSRNSFLTGSKSQTRHSPTEAGRRVEPAQAEPRATYPQQNSH